MYRRFHLVLTRTELLQAETPPDMALARRGPQRRPASVAAVQEVRRRAFWQVISNNRRRAIFGFLQFGQSDTKTHPSPRIS